MKPYQDATLPIEERLSDLLGRMTIREKVRQTDMVDGANLVSDRDPVTRRCTDKTRADPEKLRAIVGSEGIGCIHDLVPHNAALANEIQRYCRENTRLGIPVLISEEGLHGAGGAGNTILPQMIAMAATFNRDLVRQAGAVIAAEMRARGIHLTFSPVLEIARDPRWGRTEETFGEDTHLAGELAYSIVK
ncbi:MAG: beta-glucosidase, partial [Clostridiaceae bacterium]|nr:beta-glucosidase [Clostridiaceae bacterium]